MVLESSSFIKLCVAVMAYFAPVSSMIHLVLIFITIDFLTGIYASYRNKTKIVSHRLRNTVEKFVLYSSAILLGWMFQVEFANWANLAQIIAGFIAGSELISIYENINHITGLNILSKVRGIITNSIKKLINKDYSKNDSE